MFQKLSKVYSVLSCPVKRREYDEFGEDEEGDAVSGEEAEEDAGENEEITLEEIQAFLARVGSLEGRNKKISINKFSDPSKLKKNLDFQAKMSQATVYTNDILESIIDDAKEQEITELHLHRSVIFLNSYLLAESQSKSCRRAFPLLRL